MRNVNKELTLLSSLSIGVEKLLPSSLVLGSTTFISSVSSSLEVAHEMG
jgi:hypothetical protein